MPNQEVTHREIPAQPFDDLPIKLTDVSLELAIDTTDDDWVRVGERLGMIQSASQWWIGDWLNDGEANKRERYSEAVEITGLDLQTLYDSAWVASQFTQEMRNPAVSWTHHRAVAKKEITKAQKRKYLDHARSGGWTVRELKAEVRKDLGPKDLSGEYDVCPTCNQKVRKPA